PHLGLHSFPTRRSSDLARSWIGVEEPSARVAGRRQHVGIQMPGVKRASGFRARQPDLAWAEEQRIDLVEVALVALEDLVKRLAVDRKSTRLNSIHVSIS